MLTITRQFEFEAAHKLPNHEGKCKNLHGHSYKLQITMSGSIQNFGPGAGMIMDFGQLKKIVQVYVIESLDHMYLNDILEVPTAEELVLWIVGRLTGVIVHPQLECVRLYETSNSYAEWRREK